MPKKKAGRPKRERKAKLTQTEIDALLLECPWLTPEDLGIVKRRKPRKHRKKEGGEKEPDPKDTSGSSSENEEELDKSDGEGEPEGDIIEKDPALTDAELRIIRDDVHGDRIDDEQFFRLQVLGGRWTLENVGVVADSSICHARGKLVRDWCEAYRFPKQKTFSFNLYTRDGAVRLAKEVRRRANYFARIFFTLDPDELEDFEYTQDHIDKCGEDADFFAWFLGYPIGHPCYERGLEVIRISPRVHESDDE